MQSNRYRFPSVFIFIILVVEQIPVFADSPRFLFGTPPVFKQSLVVLVPRLCLGTTLSSGFRLHHWR
jgi:hypothetical protein